MTEVTIRGAGVFGLSVAWACLQRGARVRVVDPAGPAAGASGGIVGALAPHVPEAWNEKKAFQLESLLMAETFWAGVARSSGQDPGYARTGRLQPLADAAAIDLAGLRARGAADLWQGLATWEVSDAPGPFAPVSPTGHYVRDTLSARIHPRRATLALAAAVAAAGAEIVPEAPDEGIVVHATGAAGLQALSASLGRDVGQGIKGQAALLALDRRHQPQLFAAGIHAVPHDDGTLAIGSTTERDWTDPTANDDRLEALLTQARAVVPGLEHAPVVARWAGLRPRARSRAPMLGPWPGRPGHVIANGGFKIGFGMAPLAGEVLAALILEGEDRIPAGFRPEASL